MRKRRVFFALAAIATTISSTVLADVLRLKNGPAVQGVIASANSKEINFLGTDGSVKTYPISDVAGIDFTRLPAAAASSASIPAGTQIVVRTIEAIDGKTATGGMRYRASIDEPVAIGSQAAIPKGSTCTLEIVSIESGKEMAIRLRDVSVGGKSYSLSTNYADVDAQGTSKTKKAVRRGVGLGAIGAGIGALAGGASGAAIGGAVGAGVGAISAAAAKGKEINLPAETRLIFSLQAPVPLN